MTVKDNVWQMRKLKGMSLTYALRNEMLEKLSVAFLIRLSIGVLF